MIDIWCWLLYHADSVVTYEGFTPLVLAATLLVVCWYSWATYKLSKATNLTLQVDKDLLRIRRKPVISILCAEPWCFSPFKPKVASHAAVHSRVRIKVSIVMGLKIIPIEPPSHYDGSTNWRIQAYSTFTGVLGIANDKEGITAIARWPKVHIIFESWAINYYDDRREFESDESKGPPVEYYWDPGAPWPPELVPELRQRLGLILADPSEGWWVSEAAPLDPVARVELNRKNLTQQKQRPPS